MQEFKGDNSATKMMPDKNDGSNVNTGKEISFVDNMSLYIPDIE